MTGVDQRLTLDNSLLSRPTMDPKAGAEMFAINCKNDLTDDVVGYVRDTLPVQNW